MQQSIFNTISSIASSYGVPPAIAYAVAMTESQGNPNAHAVTSQEDSRGLFQINIKAHPDANSGQLFDPVYNASYIMPTLASAYNQGKSQGLTGANLASYVEHYGEKPAWNSTVDSTVKSYYNQFVSGNSGVKYLANDYPASGSNNSSGVDGSNNGGYFPGAGVPQIDPNTGLPTTNGNAQGHGSIWDNIKFYLTYAMLFILLLFALYMIFVYNPSGEGGLKKWV